MPISELGCCGPRDQAGQWSGLEYLGDGECVAFGGDPELGRPGHGPVATALLASLRCSLAVVSEVFCGGSRPSDSRCTMAARFHAVALLHRPLQPLDGQSGICGGLAFAWMVYERQEAQGRMAPRIGCSSRGHSMGGHRRGGCRHLWIQSRRSMAPAMAVAMRLVAERGVVFPWLWFAALASVHGQSIEAAALDIPLVSAAWDAGCVTRDECATLAAAFRDQPLAVWTQQAVAHELASSRHAVVLECLRSLPEWQEVFRLAALSAGRQPGSSIRLRGEVSSETSGMLLAYRSKGRSGGDVGLRASLVEGRSVVESAHLKAAGMRGNWWLGTLAAGFGQGLVVWTPSPFDDIGGMEGSHRIGRGIRCASLLQRGVWNGVGWQQNAKFLRRRRPSWCVLGKTWPDQKWTAAWGGTSVRWGWAVRMQERMDSRWSGVAGIDGQETRNGWSLRWALAAFSGGWEGRASALKTWTRVWEAHMQVERNHPRHPRWYSGEVRATPMDPEALPGFLWKCGVAFNGTWRGWVRMEVKTWGPPPQLLQRRTALRIERHGHRLDVKTQAEVGSPLEAGAVKGPLGDGHWSVLWRKLHNPSALGGPAWRWCVSAAGRDQSVGLALAFMASWRAPSNGRWRIGVAQSWGAIGAPVRYIQGWDGRPAEPFSKRGVKAFLRWRSNSGAWRLGVRLGWSSGTEPESERSMSWGIHALRVEFKPAWTSARQG